jgi:hypothetical protein
MPGLLRGVARTAVVAGTATAVSNRVSRRQAARWSGQDPYQQQYAEPPPQQYAEPAPAAPAPPAESRVQKLKDLADLKEQGVLTEAEFAAEKARILQS